MCVSEIKKRERYVKKEKERAITQNISSRQEGETRIKVSSRAGDDVPWTPKTIHITCLQHPKVEFAHFTTRERSQVMWRSITLQKRDAPTEQHRAAHKLHRKRAEQDILHNGQDC